MSKRSLDKLKAKEKKDNEIVSGSDHFDQNKSFVNRNLVPVKSEGPDVNKQRAQLIFQSDAIYRGQTGIYQNKLVRHGLGVMLYASGRVYEGFWNCDRRHGKGFERFKNGDVYVGEFFKGRAEGKGKRVWYQTSEAYEGEWYQGMRHGIGKWVIRHTSQEDAEKQLQNVKKGTSKILISETYTGRFQNNHFEGFGIYMTKYMRTKYYDNLNNDLNQELAASSQNESALKSFQSPKKFVSNYREDKLLLEIYEGEWSSSLKHGSGSEKYANGDYYVGHFREGLYDGTGKYIWANGSSFQGSYVNGKKKGKGKWIVKDGANGETGVDALKRSSIYTGDFDEDYKMGFGTQIWSTGGRYDGQFLYNKRHGQGKMMWGDGTTYEGSWRQGMQDGLGKLAFRGMQKIGIFKENQFIKDQKFLYEGMTTGIYGEFKRSSLQQRIGPLNLDLGSRHKSLERLRGRDKATTRALKEEQGEDQDDTTYYLNQTYRCPKNTLTSYQYSPDRGRAPFSGLKSNSHSSLSRSPMMKNDTTICATK